MFSKISVLRPALAVLLIFIPLYPKFPLFNVSHTFVAIRLDDFIVLSSLLILLAQQIKHGFPIFKEKITWVILPYLIAASLSTLNAVLIYQTEPPSILFLHLIRRFQYISLFFLTITTLKKTSEFRNMFYFYLIGLAGTLVYGYGQKYLSFPIISTMNSEFSKGQLLQMDVWSRVSSTFAGHYDLAAFLSVSLIIIGPLAILQKNLFTRLFLLSIWLASYNLLNLTASRVSTFAYIGGMMITLFLLKKYLWIIPVTVLFLFSIINSPELNQRLNATIPAIKKQLVFLNQPTTTPVILTPTTALKPISPTIYLPSTISTPAPTVFRHPPPDEYIPIDDDIGVARSGEIRFNVEWPRAVNAYRKNPLLGTGPGSISLATDNDYLRALGETGLLGLITLFIILAYFFISTINQILKQSNEQNTLAIIFAGGLLTFLANAVFIDVFEASKTAYMFWIMMGFYYTVIRKQNTPINSKNKHIK